MRIRFSPLAVLTLCFTAATATLHAQSTVITSLPYTISAGGMYVLNANLSSNVTSGSLITIAASNVTLDFQGHYIAGPVGNTSASTVGISAYERSNLTIQNGTIAYCDIGVDIEGNGSGSTNNVDHIIDNLRITYCFDQGIYLAFAPSSRITNCQVSQVGYSTAPEAEGIAVTGAGVTIQANTVSNLTASASDETACIYADIGSFVRQNQVSSAYFGVLDGIYQSNLADNCGMPFSGGTDAGSNSND